MVSGLAPPVILMAPLYAPAAGTLPGSETVTVVAAPAASVTLLLSTVGTGPVLRLPVEDAVPAATEMLNVTEAEPRLVTVNCCGAGVAPEVSRPKLTVDGLTATEVLTAAPASSLPAPSHSASTRLPESSVRTP